MYVMDGSHCEKTAENFVLKDSNSKFATNITIREMVKRILIIVLVLVAGWLAWFLYDSIMEPIRLDRQKDMRYNAAIARLKDIRTAQVAYRSENKKYASTFDSLITFLKEGNFSVVRQIGSLDDSAAVAEGRVRRDTIKISVRDSLFHGLNVDSLRYVPFAQRGEEFKLAAGDLKTASKVVIPVFEASVTNNVLLNGLSKQYIINLNDVARQLGKFPGLRVGSMTEATNNAGNWE